MKKTFLLLIIICLSAAVCLWFFVKRDKVDDNEAGDDKAIAIVVTGEVDEVLVKRVQAFISDNCWCPVRIRSFRRKVEDTIEAEASALSELMRKNDVCLLAMVNIPEDVKFREAIFRSFNVGLLNIEALKPVRQNEVKNIEQYARRVEKEAMRVIGQLLGLPNCPMPRCALSIARTEQDMDAKGRNFCPPCHGKVIGILKSKGVKLKF
ncbi:hypothetical protein ACFLS1_04775 [Verrucomicrobiota bacterium]